MDPIRPEFELLDSAGLDYHYWVADVETTFIAKDFTSTIKPSADAAPATEKDKANALMFLKRHIDPNLRWGYHHLKTPKELWDALDIRFGNIHDSLIPQLKVLWNEIRFLDYVKVNDFQKDVLQIQTRMDFYGKKLTDEEMILKTLSTFPTSSMILANQYRLEVDNKRITTFNRLINLLQVSERNNDILVNNNARAVGKKKIPEANHGKVNKGKGPKGKRARHSDSHLHDPYPRGDNTSRGRGRKGYNRGRGQNGHYNVWHIEGISDQSGSDPKFNKTPMNPATKKAANESAPCFKCGSTEHWYKHCKASANVAASYKKYREVIEQEANYAEENIVTPDTNLTISYFLRNKDFSPTMDVPDFSWA
ncbi:uncharacterized protein LOC113324810 [Papaver somniferum]|uniref:uncharacterized protein LOC113324810 n=1 Tax=Papaver somniferum TaxID=3469 RepID=UPI000E6FCFCC|nr:uncharacterized protein LOC113324810 [Papaver somniferum]